MDETLSYLELEHVAELASADADRMDPEHWAALYQELADECHPSQKAMVETRASNWTALVGGRGGKTTGSRARVVRRAISTPRAHILFVATTRKQAGLLLWDPLKDLDTRYDLGIRFLETDRVAIFPNGSWIMLFGCDDMRSIGKLRGIPWHEVVIDECGFYPPELLERLVERVLEPRMNDYPDTSMGLIGTPSHTLRGKFYDITRPGSDVEGWERHAWSLADSKDEGPADWQEHANRVWSAALKKKAAKGWSDDHPVWRREYLGLWAADDSTMVFRYRPFDDKGEPFNCWKPEYKNGIAILPEGDHWSYVYAVDEGYRDPFALNIFAFNPHDGRLFHVYGFEKQGMYAHTIAQLLLGEDADHTKPAGLIAATGWPVSFVGDIGEGLQAELRNVYGISIERANRAANYKHDAIELTNGDLVDQRVFIIYGSALHDQMGTLQWAPDDYGNLKEHKNMANHSTDTLIYARQAAFHQFVAPRAPKPEKLSYEERAVIREKENRDRMLKQGRRKDQFKDPYSFADWGGGGFRDFKG